MYRSTRQEERRFLKKLWKAFQELLDLVMKSASAHETEMAIRRYLASPAVRQQIERAVRQMVEFRRMDSARSWREAALCGGRGREIYLAIKKELDGAVGARVEALVRDNAQYIVTLPQRLAEDVTVYAMKQTQRGLRHEEVHRLLRQRIPAQLEWNLKTIARTETSKANAALQQARCESLGINAYIWKTCKDERVRSTHAHMQDVLCFYSDPPSPEGKGHYHPGNIYNCRCYAEPVIDWNTLPDTMRVWDGSRIVTMTKSRIRKIQGG